MNDDFIWLRMRERLGTEQGSLEIYPRIKCLCARCKGSGIIPAFYIKANPASEDEPLTAETEVDCPECDGQGTRYYGKEIVKGEMLYHETP